MDRKKKPDILERAAKKQGETPKLCSGEVNVKGKIISLKCIDVPPFGLIKHMKVLMSKTADLPMKFLLLDAEEDDADKFAATPVEADEDTPASDAPPVKAKALARARLKWIDTTRQMKSDLDSFHAAVIRQADGDPDKADIAAARKPPPHGPGSPTTIPTTRPSRTGSKPPIKPLRTAGSATPANSSPR
jgi:hypothetical protein